MEIIEKLAIIMWIGGIVVAFIPELRGTQGLLWALPAGLFAGRFLAENM